MTSTRNWNGADTGFCRYADDCNIYVRSDAAGRRVMASVAAFLEGRLRLQVNREKSAIAPTGERRFLGHRLLAGGRLGQSGRPAGADDRRGERLHHRLGNLLPSRRSPMKLHTLDQWLRRKLRCVRLKQCKRTRTIADFLREGGVPERYAWMLALSGKGWWRLAGSPQATRAMPIAWFDSLGLVRLENTISRSTLRETAAVT